MESEILEISNEEKEISSGFASFNNKIKLPSNNNRDRDNNQQNNLNINTKSIDEVINSVTKVGQKRNFQSHYNTLNQESKMAKRLNEPAPLNKIKSGGGFKIVSNSNKTTNTKLNTKTNTNNNINNNQNKSVQEKNI